MKIRLASPAQRFRPRVLARALLLITCIACAFALGRPAWSEERELSRNVVSDTDPNHKAHLFFSVRTENAFRAQVLGSNAKPVPAGGPTKTNATYHGGPVMRNPTNYLIFWEPPNNTNTFPASYQLAIEKYFQNVGDTPFYDIITQYGDSSDDPVPNSTSLGAPAYTDTKTLPPSGNNGSQPSGSCTPGSTCPLTDADIQDEVTTALAANPSWETPSLSSEYFVFTPPNVDECFNSTSCFALPDEPNGAFCAYHTYFGSDTIYAFMPFASSGDCYGSPTVYPNDVAVDIELSPTSHEMFESNSDPEFDAWYGTDGLSDEIGDKCAYNYGFVAPNGANIVLMGHPFQLQQEWSNDLTACTKRFGPAPTTWIPTSENLGPVQPGNITVLDVPIQNTGSGDLNILDIVLAAGTDPSFSLLNVPPATATLHEGDSMDVRVQFAPSLAATAGPLFGSLVIDTDDPTQTTYTTSLTGTVVLACTGSGTINVTGSINFQSSSCESSLPPAQTLTINNTGACNLDVASAVISCADFTLVNPSEFPATISADSSLGVGINFTPISAGPKSCTLTITSDDPVNPVVTVQLSGSTPMGSASLSFPAAGLTFPPTVVQQEAACPEQMTVPITNAGSCPVQINSVTLTQSSSPGDYSLSGLPGLPLSLPGGGELGAGDLDLVFEPFTVARESTGTVNVTFVNDPITGATTTDQVPFCGEAVDRGLRVLVTEGGIPVTKVKKIELQNAYGPSQSGGIKTIKTVKNALLQTVTGTAPCPSFQFNVEFGGVTRPAPLKDGTYRIKVQLEVGKKLETRVVRVVLDRCSFTPNVVVAF
jgi:hypothetical protein